jgi:hypothetical protein
MYGFELTKFKAPPLPRQIYVSIYVYVKTLAYWNATLYPKFEAIGEELSEIVSDSTASQPDIDSRHM